MQEWSIDRLLYAGEEVAADVPTGEGRVVVTSHRVLVLPADEAAPYRTLERPNVRGVSADATGGGRWVGLGVRSLVATLALAGGGIALRRSGLGNVTVPNAAASGQFGAGGAASLLRSVFGAIGALDEVALALAAVCALATAGFLALAWHARSRCLVFDLAGDESVSVPVADADASEAARAVRRALGSPPRS